MDFLAETFQDAHTFSVHFPIALLVVSAALSIVARFKPNEYLQHTLWTLLWIGTIGAIVATVTGYQSHAPYEDTTLHRKIELHEMVSIVVTGFFATLTSWRWIARRTSSDPGPTTLYTVIATIGVIRLFLSSTTGINLVHELGVNVRGANALLEQ